ncbi:glycosyltransferase [Bifidobacterium scaligerum]|uniref:Glycosyltransferase family 1 protein n=1 Tax=Bifidobacterium scaligerum TaxID=2052656 RepID=A0A2M9HSA3_9BIFI|nr:glycosyltransferase [Bifidobacterium scaligerum]PJM79669.1 glycosyltransferase family 1 protein [Bifidobacterium scaligerum]
MCPHDHKTDDAPARCSFAEPIRILQWGMHSGHGGVEQFMIDLYRHMDKNLVQFDFLAAHDAPELAFEDEILALGGRVFRVQYSQRTSPFKARANMDRFFADHPEIVGVHIHANFLYAYPLEIARRHGVKLRILHSHNSSGGNTRLGALQGLCTEWRDVIARRQIDRCPTRYLACSDSAARYMFPGKPYLWVKNGIDIERFGFSSDARQRYRREYGIGESTHVLGFCGYLTGRKNPLLALEVFTQYHKMQPDSVLMMIGCGDLFDRLKQRVRELALPERSVVFMGGNRDDVNCLYQMMDGFLLTSLYEGLPMVLVEAQCAGLPCVASREAVTDQAAITDLVRFCSLSDDARTWARVLHEGVARRVDRASYASRVAAAGFDMRATAAMLQEIYLTEGGRS